MIARTAAVVLFSAGAMMLAAAPAYAATVTNNGDKTHEVTVDLGDIENKTKIEAGKSAELDCPARCEIRVLGMSYGLAAESDTKAIIGKNGILIYAEQAARNEASHEDGKTKKTMVD